jgi:predicted RNA-binding Zn-ribbon protein involved in translation (DUF1610 family)
MQQIITAKLKLITTPEQFQALRQIQLAYRDALNAVSHYAFEHGKTSSPLTLHKGMYTELRTRYRLPSQLACSVERQVAATYRVYSQWSFAELHALISYKVVLSGSQAIKVDADYTSNACPVCGHTAGENRPHKGLLFVCQNPNCGYTLHADLVGARNITMRTLVLRQDWSTTGHLSLAPDASDNEAKAARLQRYAELRWSPDVTSLRSETGGAN